VVAVVVLDMTATNYQVDILALLVVLAAAVAVMIQLRTLVVLVTLHQQHQVKEQVVVLAVLEACLQRVVAEVEAAPLVFLDLMPIQVQALEVTGVPELRHLLLVPELLMLAVVAVAHI
jgi:hypothetical protein